MKFHENFNSFRIIFKVEKQKLFYFFVQIMSFHLNNDEYDFFQLRIFKSSSPKGNELTLLHDRGNCLMVVFGGETSSTPF